MEQKLKTIKVLPETIQDLNLISAMTNEKQYEVVGRLASAEKKIIKTKKKIN